MTNEQKEDNVVSCLLKQGFSLPEALRYLRNFQQESKALRNTHLFRNGGIKRVPNRIGE
jgi:hypothetical protein